MLVKAISGRHIVMAQMSSPTPALYLICILLASSACLDGSVGPIAALNFFNHVGSVGSGVGLFAVRGTLPSQELRYFSQNFEM